jgi:hypothetical protein
VDRTRFADRKDPNDSLVHMHRASERHQPLAASLRAGIVLESLKTSGLAEGLASELLPPSGTVAVPHSPVLLSQVRVPQDQPRRQSGRQAETSAEHTYPVRQRLEAEQLAMQREFPSWKARQAEPVGQAEVAQSWVQVPAVQLVPLVLEVSGMHKPPWQSVLSEQNEPTDLGVTVGAAQAPVLESHTSDEPQDQPRRQSGRQAETSAEHT